MNTLFLKIPVLTILATLGFATDAWLTSTERPQVMNAVLDQLHGGSEQTIQIEQSHQLRSLRRVGIAGMALASAAYGAANWRFARRTATVRR